MMDLRDLIGKELGEHPEASSVRLLSRAVDALEVAEAKARELRPGRQAEAWAAIATATAAVGDLAATIQGVRHTLAIDAIDVIRERLTRTIVEAPEFPAEPQTTDDPPTPSAVAVIVALMRRLGCVEIRLDPHEVRAVDKFSVDFRNTHGSFAVSVVRRSN